MITFPNSLSLQGRLQAVYEGYQFLIYFEWPALTSNAYIRNPLLSRKTEVQLIRKGFTYLPAYGEIHSPH